MTYYTVASSKLSGTIKIPASKSHTLRAILLASLATGISKITDYLPSPDTEAMIAACRQLGAIIESTETVITVQGNKGKPTLADDVINVGNSGQVLRFVAAIAALNEGYTVLTGDHSVRYNRPIQPLIEGLTGLGATCISTKNDGHAPLLVKGPLTSGITHLAGEDSQPVSALLMVSAFLSGTTTIKVRNPGEKPWIALTLDWLDKLGIAYTHDNFESYTIKGKPKLDAFNYRVPGDFSSLAYPLVAALITHSSLTISNVAIHDIQGDKKVIDLLQQMGAVITISDKTLQVKPSFSFQGITIDINECIDALPILAVMGCYAKGTTRLLNAGIARKKESDRLAAITRELKKMGAKIEEEPTALTIHESPLKGAVMDSHHDHRIALALTVAALGASSVSTITNITCIAKSYQNFHAKMNDLGAQITLHE